MFRFTFTIRDMLWAMALVAMGLGWWMDHRLLHLAARGWRAEYAKLYLRLVPLEAFDRDSQRISKILSEAEKSPPSPETAAETLHYVRYHDDSRVRIRAMLVLPHLNERTEAIN